MTSGGIRNEVKLLNDLIQVESVIREDGDHPVDAIEIRTTPQFPHGGEFTFIAPSYLILADTGRGVTVNEDESYERNGFRRWCICSSMPQENYTFPVTISPLSQDWPRENRKNLVISVNIGYSGPGAEKEDVLGVVRYAVRTTRLTRPGFEGLCVVDFGTTNSCVVIRGIKDTKPRIVMLPKSNKDGSVPSAIFYEGIPTRERPRVRIGEEAIERIRRTPKRGVLSVKRFLGSGRKFFVGISYQEEAIEYTAREVSSHILREILRGAEQYTDRRIRKLKATFPTAHRLVQRKHLTRAYRAVLGIDPEVPPEKRGRVDLTLDEATAAALAYMDEHRQRVIALWQTDPEAAYWVLCYDFGGGTTDLSVVRFQVVAGDSERQRFDIDAHVAARDGLPYFGGDQVTLALFGQIKVQIAATLAKRIDTKTKASVFADEELATGVYRPYGHLDDPDDRVRDAARQLVAQHDAVEAFLKGDPSRAEDVLALAEVLLPTVWMERDLTDPTKLLPIRPEVKASEQRFRFAMLWGDAERLKKRLGLQTDEDVEPITHEIYLYDEHGTIDLEEVRRVQVSVHRDHVLEAVRPDLEKGFDLALALAKEALADSDDQLNAVICAGNSCHFKPVRTTLLRRLNEGLQIALEEEDGLWFNPERAKASVAFGAYLMEWSKIQGAAVKWTVDSSSKLDRLTEHVFRHVERDETRREHLFRAGTTVPCITSMRFDGLYLGLASSRNPQARGARVGTFTFTESIADPRKQKSLLHGLDVLQRVHGRQGDLARRIQQTNAKFDPSLKGRVVIILTQTGLYYAWKDGAWYGMRVASHSPLPEVDPFSGIH